MGNEWMNEMWVLSCGEYYMGCPPNDLERLLSGLVAFRLFSGARCEVPSTFLNEIWTCKVSPTNQMSPEGVSFSKSILAFEHAQICFRRHDTIHKHHR